MTPEELRSQALEDAPAVSSHPLEREIDSKPINVPLTMAGGALMGAANVIPGVSGGTMILALGLYEDFIESAASVTRLRRVARPYIFLAVLGAANLISIGVLAGLIESSLKNYHMATFAAFIGLAMGGVPVIWRRMERPRAIDWVLTVAGLLVMLATASAFGTTQLPETWLVYFVAGALAAGAMVLPGISGSHLLLVVGLYSPIIAAVRQFKDAGVALDISAAWAPAFNVIAPVGFGVLTGILILTNLLEWLLERHHQAIMAFLLGLLAGSVFPINPFRAPSSKDLFTEAAVVTPGNLAIVAAMVVVGFLLAEGVSRLGGGEEVGPYYKEDAAAEGKDASA